MTTVAVVRVGAGDWQLLKDLRLRALRDAPDAFGSTYEDSLAQDDDHWRGRAAQDPSEAVTFVAVDGGRWVGMSVGVMRPDDRGNAHLYGMWVDPSYRRRRVGAALVEAVINWARDAGAVRVALGVTEANAGAAQFYVGLGFVPTGERAQLREGSPLRIQIMERRL